MDTIGERGGVQDIHVPVPLLVRYNWRLHATEPFDPYDRIQPGYGMELSYPTRSDGSCACGCGEKLEGRQKRWRPGHADVAFRVLGIRAGLTGPIRAAVLERDGGICALCGVDAEPRKVPGELRWVGPGWEADHIVPVVEGGGACGLDNFRTACIPCHKRETAALAGRRASGRRGEVAPLL